MANYSVSLEQLASELFEASTLVDLQSIKQQKPLPIHQFVAFDSRVGGPGFFNVDCYGHGRYEVEDRDIFRPLQYCRVYFEMIARESQAEWLTREVVHMSSLHIENLVKRIGRVQRMPLGKVLREIVVKRKLAPVLWDQIVRYTAMYNASKHDVDQPKDTHLFSTGDAILAYTICRKFAVSLYPHVTLKTDLAVFDKECDGL